MPKPDEQKSLDEKISDQEENVEENAETTDQQSPWEKNGEEFDADRAAKLIQNLRAELAAAKAKNKESAPSDEQEAEEPAAEEPAAEEPAAEEPAAATEDMAALKAQLVETELKLTKTLALAEAGLSLDFLPYVPGRTEEEIKTSIEFLLSKFNEARSSSRRTPSVNPAQVSRDPAEDPKESAARAFFGM